MEHQPVIGTLEDDVRSGDEDNAITLKTEWKRKGDRVNFFTKEASNADFFDLLKAPAPSLKEKTVMDGWLTKQGGKGITQNWRRRWFVLTYDKYLYYYKSEQDEFPTGVIFLDDYDSVSAVEDTKRKFRFNLHSNNENTTIRVFRFSSDTRKEQLQWISAIEQVFRAPKLDNSRTKIVQRTLESEDHLRRLARLYVRVGEARNLPKALTGSSTSSYCIVDLQDKQVRTQTIWATREPMWMEDFYLDVLNPDEEVVKITCWRMERAGKGDVIGQVEIPIQSLTDHQQHEQWYPLAGTNANQYIAGEVHLKLEYKRDERNLLVQVVGAKNLAPKGVGGTSNPYIRLHLGKRKKKTKTINKTLFPTFNDLFEFKLKPDDAEELVLVVWHRDMLNSLCMGRVVIPYTELEPNYLYDGWYVITANETATASLGGEEDEEDGPSTSLMSSSSSSALLCDLPGPMNDIPTSTRKSTIMRPMPAAPGSPVWALGNHRAHSQGSLIGATPARMANARGSASDIHAPPSSLGADSPASSPLGERRLGVTRGQTTIPTPAHTRKASGLSASTSETVGSASGGEGGERGERAPYKPLGQPSELGDLRLVLKYTEETVLPSVEYTELLSLLMDEGLDVVRALSQVTHEKEDVGRCLSQIFEAKGRAEDLIIALTCDEVRATDDPDVLFRANSLATKTFDYYLKLVALPYLHATLEEVIRDIYTTKKPCEVDPTRMDKGEDLARNFSHLLSFAEEICYRIFSSVDQCPHKIRKICYALRESVKSKYCEAQVESVKYTAVSGFLFLRFFCPAIMGPKLFDVMKEHPDMKTSRILTLLAKTLQNLSNLCEFGYKEAYMKDMNVFIVNHTSDFKLFMDAICSRPDAPRREDAPPINFGREMATIHRHLVNNLQPMLALQPDNPPILKLAGTLERLRLVQELYLMEM